MFCPCPETSVKHLELCFIPPLSAPSIHPDPHILLFSFTSFASNQIISPESSLFRKIDFERCLPGLSLHIISCIYLFCFVFFFHYLFLVIFLSSLVEARGHYSAPLLMETELHSRE